MDYSDIPLWLSLVFMLGGLAALAWSSDFFVDGASVLAKSLGISPFVIGMVIIGFGTSAPELCVSAMSGLAGHPELSLGNAYGSCSFNIAVILGVAVMIFPLVVKPRVALVAGPALSGIALLSLWILSDRVCSRTEAFLLLGLFAVLLPAYCWFDQQGKDGDVGDAKPGREAADAKWRLDPRYRRIVRRRIGVGAAKTVVGLVVLVASSHFLVWGAVDFAHLLNVSDLVIGLTIIAAGTSLPELASAVASARRGEHEFVLGNIIGSNFFNTLAVVGLATAISPIVPPHAFSPYILTRDLPVMIALSLSITLFGLNWRHPSHQGVIRRREAFVWLLAFVAYTGVMLYQESRTPASPSGDAAPAQNQEIVK